MGPHFDTSDGVGFFLTTFIDHTTTEPFLNTGVEPDGTEQQSDQPSYVQV